jgi:hypothetical protein
MCSLWKRGLRTWPYLVAGLAFVVSTGFATQYGMEHKSAARSPEVFEGVAVAAIADHAVVMSGAQVRQALSEVIESIDSVGAVFWPLMTLLAVLLMLRLGAAIAGIGYDCGRVLIWITALVVTVIQARVVA